LGDCSLNYSIEDKKESTMINAASHKMGEIDPKKELRPPGSWHLDSRLARIATWAAVEFDWLLRVKRGRTVPNLSRDAIKTLSSYLREAIGKTETSSTTKALIDSTGVKLCVKAYSRDTVRTPEQLRSIIDELKNLLERSSREDELSEDELIKLGDFCVALSENIDRYRDKVYGNRYEHPYHK
jgi:hypothetical protein